MQTSSILLVLVLVTCSVWTIQGRSIEIDLDDEEPTSLEIHLEASKLPGKCWACKWALNKVKNVIGPNTTAESVKTRLNSVCNEIGLLKSLCRRFVKGHLGELIEELTTTDDVRTICVKTGACKPKEVSRLLFYPKSEATGVYEIIKYP